MPRALVHRVLVAGLILVIGLSASLRTARMQCSMGKARASSCCCPASKERGSHQRRPRPGDPAAIDKASCCAVVDVGGPAAAAPAIGAPTAPEPTATPVIVAMVVAPPRPVLIEAPRAQAPPSRPPRTELPVRLL